MRRGRTDVSTDDRTRGRARASQLATSRSRSDETASAAEPELSEAESPESPPPRRRASRRSSARQRGGESELRAVTAVVTAFPDLFAADLTARQRRIIEFIREAVERYGYPPSVREIGEADLADARGIAVALNGLPDELDDAPLPCGQVGREQVWKRGHHGGAGAQLGLGRAGCFVGPAPAGRQLAGAGPSAGAVVG